jgi:hypothetical protein
MSLKLVHVVSQQLELRYQELLLFRYVYAPQVDVTEVRKPYFHPLCTLAGDEVTLFRPHDHLWHHGLAMTSAQLSGQNFWGGPTYVRGRGYVPLENYGRIEHVAWDEVACDGTQVRLHERLRWVTYGGEHWLDEERHISVTELNPEQGYWSLDLAFALHNRRGQDLVFGSPTTEGRPLAGYGGLFWRGPRSFLKGTVLAAGGLEGPEVMGQAAPWLAYIGRHDGSGNSSTLIFLDSPQNPRHPTKWFVRNDPYACASASFMFDQEYVLPPEQALRLRYRVVLACGAWSRDQIETYVGAAFRSG